MPRSDVHHTVSTQSAPRHVDVGYLPSAYRRHEADPLRAIAFWNGHHQYEPPTETGALRIREAIRAERLAALAELAPQLIGSAQDQRPARAQGEREVERRCLAPAQFDRGIEVKLAGP